MNANGPALGVVWIAVFARLTLSRKADQIPGRCARTVCAMFLALLVTACGGGEEDTEIFFVHSDHLGTPEIVTNKDKTPAWEGQKEPFGKTEVVTNTIDLNIRFPGQYYDQETGLHYNMMRYYDPGTGRYLQSDPIRLDGGVSTYGYAYQNPVMAYDPNGEFAALLPLLFNPASVNAYINLIGMLAIVIAFNEGEWGDEWDGEIPDPRYGGYDPTDEALAEDLANNLTGQESCDVIADAIEVLENRIRGRRENIDDDFCGSGDENHEQRIRTLQGAKSRLENALRNGECT